MKRTCVVAAVAVTIAAGASLVPGAARAEHPSKDKAVRVLAAYSVRDSGLLGALLVGFTRQTGYVAETLIGGSGQLLDLAEAGEGDVLLTNWPAAEQRWIKSGIGESRAIVMYDRFVLLGPATDPAAVQGHTPEAALQAISAKHASFVSHGDASGENVRELQVWAVAGLDPQGEGWYHQSDGGAARTLKLASDEASYVFSDRATFRVWQDRLALKALVENDPRFINVYHVLVVSQARFPESNQAGARAFADYLVSREGQAIIAAFGRDKLGDSLYTPAAGADESKLLAPISKLPQLDD